ncbi:MAG: substrate-binding domain-containing protein [Acidimicrobiales bacterium]
MASFRTLIGMVAVGALVAVACGDGGDAGDGGAAPDPFFDEPIDLDPSQPELGPNGEPATPVAEIAPLTDAELAQIRAEAYTAALLWAGAGEWYNALGAGASDAFEQLGIEVVATADAQFDPAKQANDVESAMALAPDIVLTLIVDPVSGAEGFRPVVDSDTVLVLADNGAEGYEAGREYVAVVTGDHYGMGRAAAEVMAEAVGGEGEIGMVFHDADFFVTNNRDDSFRATIEQQFPDVTIVDAKGFTEEPATFDAASAMISQHPEIEGIYVAWDVAAEGVVEALRAAGREDVWVVTHDLGVNNAVAMARGEIVYATVADLPYQIGQTMATLAGYGLVGRDAPPFVAGELITVKQEDLEEAWPQSLHRELPAEVQGALG